MRIQKIEVVGFKSFADRQVVILDDHITGVIGPNGCGKSNIVDAMRWCLGEQRAKHLRGSGMADVIFSGCATRGAAASAQVTVSFSNDGNVPMAYLNFSEIAITRRLFRDGSSEYLINGVVCRLRDITELLMGTGIGTKGYSIIEQGRVSDIVVSKPKDRRAMLDEAAGVTKFKVQKATAEKRIGQTQQNLDRVNDLVTELSGRLGSLKKAADKAERFLQLREELRDVDLWVSSHRYLGLLARYDIVSSQLGKSKEELETLTQELDAHDEAVGEQKDRASELEQRLASEQERVYEIENRQQLAAQDQRFRQQSQDGHEDRIGKLKAQLQESVVAQERFATEQGEHESTLEQMDKDARGESGGEGVADLDEAHSEIAVALKSTQQDLAGAQSRRNDCVTKTAELKASLWSRAESEEQERERVQELATQRDALASEGQQDAEQLQEHEALAQQKAGELVNLVQERSTQEAERSRLRGELRLKAQAQTAAQTACTQTRSRLESLKEIQGRYRGCDSGVQVLIKAAQQSDQADFLVRGIAADYLTVPAQWDRALSAVLGERLQGLVVPDAEHSRQGIDLLVQKEEGRSVFFPDADLDPVDAAQGLDQGSCVLEHVALADKAPIGLRNLLAKVWCVEDLNQALSLWAKAAQLGLTLVTANGDVLEPSGVVIGGSAKSLDSALLEQKREIATLEGELAHQEGAMQRAQAEETAAQVALDAIEQAQETLQSRYVEAEKEAMQARQDLQRIQEEQERRVQGLERLDAELLKLNQELERKQDERTDLEERLAHELERLPEIEEEVASLEEKLETLTDKREGIATMLTQAKVEQARRKEQRSATASAIERTQQALAQERLRQETLQAEIEGAQQEFQENEQAIEALKDEQEELSINHEQGVAARDESARALSEAKEELVAAEQAIKSQREHRDRAHEAFTKATSRLEDLESKQESLRETVQERHQVELLEVLLDHHDRPLANKDTEQQATSLRRRLQGLGDVNLTAIEEYQEVQERYTYLCDQQKDLAQAIGQLQAAIDKINETTRQRFEETFHTVNEKFQSIFPRLFAGGKAELKLTDPDDMLNTGVDIVAQPPGKRVSSLELMSGGEKALTAVSLIFGIFLIKPSPFCLLDEVDAPLDEANVGRFCDLVRELSQETQFIIITHNKRTMEAADRLYGVTMQQRGISKLVSVNMRRSLDKGKYAKQSTPTQAGPSGETQESAAAP